jgi:hypothetical protein
VDCPQCGNALVCAACGAAIEHAPRDIGGELENLAKLPEAEPTPPPGDQTFLIVAKGHTDLLAQLQGVVGDLGWVRLVEDRRADETILPREGRQGTVHVDREITP